MNLTLHVWRQPGPAGPGGSSTYEAPDISPDMSFLEMLDVVNERLMSAARSRSRSITIAARASAAACADDQRRGARPVRRPRPASCTCALQRRRRDLDRAVARAGVPGDQGSGRRSQRVRPDHAGRRLHHASTGGAPEAQRFPIPKATPSRDGRRRMHRLRRLRRGCPNGSALLFTAAKLSHLRLAIRRVDACRQQEAGRRSSSRRLQDGRDEVELGAQPELAEPPRPVVVDPVGLAFHPRLESEAVGRSRDRGARAGCDVLRA